MVTQDGFEEPADSGLQMTSADFETIFAEIRERGSLKSGVSCRRAPRRGRLGRSCGPPLFSRRLALVLDRTLAEAFLVHPPSLAYFASSRGVERETFFSLTTESTWVLRSRLDASAVAEITKAVVALFRAMRRWEPTSGLPPVFDHQAVDSIEVPYISGGNDEAMRQSCRADQHIFQPDGLSAGVELGEKVASPFGLFRAEGQNLDSGEHLAGDPIPQGSPIWTPGGAIPQLKHANGGGRQIFARRPAQTFEHSRVGTLLQ
jgi:hypothetical protein